MEARNYEQMSFNKLFRMNDERANDALSGVLACDKWTVFSDSEIALNTGATIGATIKMAYTKVLYPNGTAIQRLNTKIYVDTLLLANVWRYIKKEITWKSFSHELS